MQQNVATKWRKPVCLSACADTANRPSTSKRVDALWRGLDVAAVRGCDSVTSQFLVGFLSRGVYMLQPRFHSSDQWRYHRFCLYA